MAANKKTTRTKKPPQKSNQKTNVTTTSTKKAPKRTRTKKKTVAPMVLRPFRIPTHDQIAKRAYQLWERSGHRHGDHREHWLIAEAELTNGL